jgi:hypothetical protein
MIANTTAVEWDGRDLLAEVVRLREERDRLRGALAAYRSALRSGERESAQLCQIGDVALSSLSEQEDA